MTSYGFFLYEMLQFKLMYQTFFAYENYDSKSASIPDFSVNLQQRKTVLNNRKVSKLWQI